MTKTFRAAYAGELSLPQTFWAYYQIPLLVTSVFAMYLVITYIRTENVILGGLAILGYIAAALFVYVMGFGVFRSIRARGRDSWGVLAGISVLLNMVFLPIVITGLLMGLNDVKLMKAEREAARQKLEASLQSDAAKLSKNSLDSQVLYYGDRVVYVRQIDPAFTQDINFDSVKQTQLASTCQSMADELSNGALKSVGFRYEFTDRVVEFSFNLNDCQQRSAETK